jgi:voltage-gated potassium channel
MNTHGIDVAVAAPADVRAGLKLRTLQVLEVAEAGDRVSRAFDVFILSLIVLNVVALVVGSMPAVEAAYGAELALFEAASVGVFTLEYLARVWSCTSDPRFAGRFGRIRYARRPLSLVDLLAVLPYWLPFVGVDLRVLRALRLFQIFRVAKLGRYSVAMQALGDVVYTRRAELAVTAAMGGVLLTLASALMYFAESTAQPDTFGSIPAAMWWAVATLTTVGYGDVVPVTTIGRVLAGVIAVLGIGMFALPTGILGAAFTEELQARRRSRLGRCPRCGK